MTTGARTCRRCGEPIPTGILAGNCPRCLVSLALSTTDDKPLASSPSDRDPPQRPARFFADYEILGELARGGMGVVYRARQVSLNRLVALKMIGAGQFASFAQVQRFRLEAEAAARLDHPNIVPIFEVGEHEDQHFYSMKLIDGGNLAAVIANPGSGVSNRRKAALLARLAHAVHYAHQRGILHRDLKPTNILIGANGEPHITDFGLAKLIEDDASLTQTVAVLGTPAYMAPELASGRAAEATTAADIYSLGAVFYELLARRPPFIAENVPALLRKIVEEEPTPPSALKSEGRRSNSEIDPQPQPQHRARAPRLRNSHAGFLSKFGSRIPDLDVICLKCLEKDTARRYTSARALAEDLERWLAGEPIRARSASAAEKAWRWCRRRPAMAALWSALIIALASGVTGIVWQWRRAKTDEHLATIEAGKSRQLAEFLRQMLARAGPSASLGRDTTLLREILDQTAERIDRELTTQPAVAAELRDTIGRTYYDLGDYAKAVAMHREALRLRRQWAGHQQDEVAQSIHLLAQALASQGVLDEAEALDREALALRTKLFGPHSTQAADSLNNIGNIYFRRRELSQAQRYFEQALAIYRGTDNQSRTAAVLNNLANVLELKPDYAAAEKLYREAVEIARRIHGDSHPSTALYLRNLGESLRGQDKLKEADAIHSEALAVRASLLDELHPLLVDSFERLAQTKKQEEKLAEAETLYRKALALRRKQSPGDPRKWSDDAYAVAALLCQRKEFDESERLLGELLDASKDNDPRTASLRAARGNIRARYGRWRDAISDLARAFDLEPTNQWHALHLATLLAETGEREAYSAFCRKCLDAFAESENPDIAQRMAFACLLAPVDELDQQAVHRLVDHALDAGPNYDNRPYAMAVKAMAEYRSGRAPEAVQRLDALLEQINSGQFQPGRYLNIEVRALLALAHHASGRREEARQWLAAAQEFAPAKLQPPANGDYGEFWREWLMLHVLIREAEQIENPRSATNTTAPKR